MSISDKLTYLSATKALIKQAIIDKGVAVASGDTFRSYATKIGDIVTNSTTWVRPAEWLALPVVNAGENKMYGVYAIYENEYNALAIQIGGGLPSTIYWGDGTTQSANNLVVYTKVYDYAAASGPVSVDRYGRNYKQVLVQIDFVSSAGNQTTSIFLDASTGLNLGGPNGWLDIIISCPYASVLRFTNTRPALNLERVRVLDHIVNSPNTTYLNILSLRVMDFDIPLANNYQNTYQKIGNARRSNGDPLSITCNATTQFSTTFSNAMFTEFGVISSTSATSATSTFQNCFMMEKLGAINLPAATNITSFLNGCYRLRGTINFTTSSSLTTLNSAFSECYSLDGVIFSECSGVTAISNTFLACNSLKTLRLPHIKVSFTIANCKLERAALVTLFNDLGTPVTTQTITITNNPGASSLSAADRLIATSKNWTIVG